MEDQITDGQPRRARATLSDAHDAFFRGDFEGCLRLCDAIVTQNARRRFEVSLLRARILLRLRRAHEALAALTGCAFVPTSADGIATAEMLRGIAHVQLGHREKGESILQSIDAMRADIHPTIRAELALNRGIAHFCAKRYEQADSCFRAVPPDADIITARALEYRGWTAHARGNVQRAAESFEAAFDHVNRCARKDRFLEASVLQGLGTVWMEGLDVGRWPEIEARIETFAWDGDGLARPRFWTSINGSVMRELLGDDDGALRWARRAATDADNDLHRAIALCRTAEIFAYLGEARAQIEFAERARSLYDGSATEPVTSDTAQIPLLLAEHFAKRDPHFATTLLERHEALRNVVEPPDARIHLAERSMVDGAIAESSGDRNHAVRAYASAFRAFRAQGRERRASMAALRLAGLTGARVYRAYLTDALERCSRRYWLAKHAFQNHYDVPSLTDTQRTILTLVAQGKTYKEIGAQLNRSWKTVNNSVEHLRAKFGVRTRGELVAEALRVRAIDAQAELGIGRSA